MLKQLLVTLLITAGVLASITWLASSLRVIELIVNRGVSVGMFIALTVLRIPEFLTIVLPIAMFISVVFVYSKLNSDREIVIMRAAGVSPFALARPALILAGAVTLFCYSLSLYFMPNSYERFRMLQWDIRHSYGHLLLQEGMFNPISNDITVFVRARSGDGELHGILIQDDRDPDQRRTVIGERGALIETPQGARVVAFNGNQQVLDRRTKKLSILFFDRHSFDLGATGGGPDVRYREARERGIGELLSLSPGDVQNAQDYGRFKVEAHQRLMSPLANISFTLVALLCLISGDFSRRGQVRRVTLAVALVVLLQIAGLGLGNMVAKTLNFVPVLYLLGLAPIAVALPLLVSPPKLRLSRVAEALMTRPAGA
jgi:lipopolysaccharide export system permease protein